ncbi:MAG: DUF721 domain-containing protein [Candidatus Eremiobacteraeota bacterium]|nr:DUF721 domain-containing protein [Candidatus Eremiobacteraeota bacterium]MBC5802974.1 DUF721 domain-containing protein [Candidatus Eremiobacteraeota bacterium]MBC5822314.1 DUF721 domain-containing protein [Candidatus Eremiobacteraeota bacterium]
MSLRPLRAALDAWSPGGGNAGEPLAAIAAAWPEIVGPKVAEQCAPVELHGDALFIATRSSAWSQQLQLLSTTILTGVNRCAPGTPVARLMFRAARLRPRERRPVGHAAKLPVRRSEAPPEPAADAWDALERVRRRLGRLRHSVRARCTDCGVALSAGGGSRCPPCASAAADARSLATQRVLYATPWLDYAALREQLPALAPAEYEGARRHLLGRWWSILERARRAGGSAASGFERRIANSYVLLRSQLPPGRITPAVVRNLLGPELERLTVSVGPHGGRVEE